MSNMLMSQSNRGQIGLNPACPYGCCDTFTRHAKRENKSLKTERRRVKRAERKSWKNSIREF